MLAFVMLFVVLAFACHHTYLCMLSTVAVPFCSRSLAAHARSLLHK
jgi:hypothetical protein